MAGRVRAIQNGLGKTTPTPRLRASNTMHHGQVFRACVCDAILDDDCGCQQHMIALADAKVPEFIDYSYAPCQTSSIHYNQVPYACAAPLPLSDMMRNMDMQARLMLSVWRDSRLKQHTRAITHIGQSSVRGLHTVAPAAATNEYHDRQGDGEGNQGDAQEFAR